MNFLLANHISSKLAKDLESVIRRFENGDMSIILETEKMFEIIKKTHSMLSKILDIDSYEDMFKAANSDVNATVLSGKIIRHCAISVVEDLLPNYSFNIHTQRFLQSPIIFQATGREKDPKLPSGSFGFGQTCVRAWDFFFRLSRGFIGAPHFACLARMIGEPGIELVMENCMQHIEKKFKDMEPYLSNMIDGLPPITLPKAMYGTAAAFGMFESRLKQYFNFMEHLDECFKGFKEIGNVVALVSMLESAISSKQCAEYINSAAFLGVPCSLKSEYDGLYESRPRRRSR